MSLPVIEFEHRYPARIDRLAEIRVPLAGVLRSMGAAGEVVGDVVLAVDEICRNIIRHAYHGGAGGPRRRQRVPATCCG